MVSSYFNYRLKHLTKQYKVVNILLFDFVIILNGKGGGDSLKKAILLTFCVIFTFFIFAMTLSWLGYFNSNDLTIKSENVRFEGESIYGKSVEELRLVVQEKVELAAEEKAKLILGGKSEEYGWGELGIYYDVDKIVLSIIGSQNSMNFFERVKLKFFEREFLLDDYAMFDEDRLKWTFQDSLEKEVQSAKNAHLKIEGGVMKVSAGKSGKKVDYDLLKLAVLDAKMSGQVDIPVPLSSVSPEVTKEDILSMKIESKIATYKTTHSPDDKDKIHNIKLAGSSFDGKLLKPDEVFSFFDLTGPPTYDSGYRDGNAYVGGKLVQDVGGGICQLSSTVYNTALLSGMEVVERHQHGMPVNYVPAGQDATLWFGSKDLKFKNTTGGYVYIQVETTENSLEVSFYGPKSEYTYTMDSLVTERIPPKERRVRDNTLPAGSQKVVKGGVSGYRSETYRIVQQGSKVVSKELVSKDYYKPMERLIHYN